jgi:hypothetical protein
MSIFNTLFDYSSNDGFFPFDNNDKTNMVFISIDSEPYLSGKINQYKVGENVTKLESGEVSINGFYFGSGTRIGSVGTIYNPNTGFDTKDIKIIETDSEGNEIVILDKRINFAECADKTIKESNKKLKFFNLPVISDAKDEELLVKICPFDDFSKYTLESNGKKITFSFRSLHRFNNDVEISGFSYI